jgi:MerR family mercuric resistance operon transcriptional regulator
MSEHVPEKGLQRAELARRTGCNIETIRYYEKIGMMPDPPRTAAGYRVYNERAWPA